MSTKNITVDEAKEVLAEAEEAKRKAWQEYNEAKRNLNTFSLGEKPCPKCGGEMKCGFYQAGHEPHESIYDPYATFSISSIFVGYDPATGTTSPKKNSKWHWQVEKLLWKCDTCGYSFHTKPKDAH